MFIEIFYSLLFKIKNKQLYLKKEDISKCGMRHQLF